MTFIFNWDSDESQLNEPFQQYFDHIRKITYIYIIFYFFIFSVLGPFFQAGLSITYNS